MVVNIHEAKSKLSQLVERALAGEEVVIAKSGKALVRLTVLETPAARELGFARGVVRETPGWEKPLDDREIAEIFGTEI